ACGACRRGARPPPAPPAGRRGWLSGGPRDRGHQPGDPAADGDLAQLCADLLPEAWIAWPPVYQLRALPRHRIQLVRLRTLLRSLIHAVWPTMVMTGPRARRRVASALSQNAEVAP